MKALLGIIAWLVALGAGAAELRYPDVAYLDEIGVNPPTLRVVRDTGLRSTPDPHSVLWTLANGQPVLLIGYHEKLFYVEAQVNTGPARGWVDATAMEQIAAATAADWRKKYTALLERRALIAQRRIGVGFSPAEVIAAIGKPDRVITSGNPKIRQEQWEYSILAQIPFYEYYIGPDGRAVISRSYFQNCAVGSRTVIFRDDRVVEYREDTPKINRTPRPIFLGYQR